MSLDLEEQQRWGSEIAAQGVALAHASVELQFERDPGLRERFGEAGVAKSFDDARHNLEFLAESVSLGSPATFSGYVRWLDDILRAAHVLPGVIPSHLGCLKEVILARLSSEAAAQAVRAIDHALAAIAEKRTGP